MKGRQVGNIVVLDTKGGQLVQGGCELDIGQLVSVQIKYFQVRVVG